MKRIVSALAIAAICFASSALAQQNAATDTQGAKLPAQSQAESLADSPADFDKQYAQLQALMNTMHQQMEKIRATQDPQERQRLLHEHWATMQSAMTMMHGTFGGRMGFGRMGGGSAGKGPMEKGMANGAPGGRHMMHGPMMNGAMMGGPMMMWGDYDKLTPEQLKERQYMMDRWMPMQQMMMEQMLEHQHWMMQIPPPPPPKK